MSRIFPVNLQIESQSLQLQEEEEKEEKETVWLNTPPRIIWCCFIYGSILTSLRGLSETDETNINVV